MESCSLYRYINNYYRKMSDEFENVTQDYVINFCVNEKPYIKNFILPF